MRESVVTVVLMLLLFGTSAHGATTIGATIDECRKHLGPVLTGEYEVVITFSGITMFERRDGDGVMNARMINAGSGRPALKDPDHPLIPSHTAYILADFETARLLLDEGVPLHQAYFEGECYYYYPLRGHVVTVDDGSVPKAENGTLCVTDKYESGKYCPNEDPSAGVVTKGSMHWVPSIKTVLGANQTKKKGHFDDVFEPAALSAMVPIDRGYLETVVTNPMIWDFKKKKADGQNAPQAIAQEVRWHMRGKGTELRLKLKSKSGKEIVLKFLPVNGRVSLFIANNPADETGPIRTAHEMPTDDHFRLYYEFIDAFDVKNTLRPFKEKECQVKPEKPTLQPCSCTCPKDPNCPIVADGVPSGLNCGPTQWP